jgi:hypothetical protein
MAVVSLTSVGCARAGEPVAGSPAAPTGQGVQGTWAGRYSQIACVTDAPDSRSCRSTGDGTIELVLFQTQDSIAGEVAFRDPAGVRVVSASDQMPLPVRGAMRDRSLDLIGTRETAVHQWMLTWETLVGPDDSMSGTAEWVSVQPDLNGGTYTFRRIYRLTELTR